ncbi:MAG: DNA/RNA nuclease SfsA [Jaaginema sp. PMC 1079.18]|nr:DNA/RNA nuclease SfsA [Jaaginema sp. PMC 1080.18]MEC4850720.1 DNA/RNA nuclease SfsA [Jaaginema sp. PMC 1079.18]MEC4867727.1 DNA/RNA nuclease SfsA [Jaaginema sp. PMC 1078.18]
MAESLLYTYPPLQEGILLKRYKRFLADIELTSGEIITAHCPNTGPMTGLAIPGLPVQVSRSNNPKRKLPYTWEMIQVNDTTPTWVGTNTSLPNKIVKIALAQQLFPELTPHYTHIRPEVPYGINQKSRIDFLLTHDDQPPIYLEVKSTTWAKAKLALFPDTVTTRGQKHLQDLMAVIPQAKAVMLYFINRGDCTHFSPGDAADPRYGELLRQARSCGVQMLPYRFDISPQGIRFLGLADLGF